MTTPAQPTPATPRAVEAARALLKDFQQKFAVFRDHQPLAIGIDKQLLARFPDLDRKLLRTALRIHTNSTPYLKAMGKATVRFDLDGNAADEVSETHRNHATTTLDERFKKVAEQRKAQREAEQAQREAEQAERRRSAKLEQLAAKFSRRS